MLYVNNYQVEIIYIKAGRLYQSVLASSPSAPGASFPNENFVHERAPMSPIHLTSFSSEISGPIPIGPR